MQGPRTRPRRPVNPYEGKEIITIVYLLPFVTLVRCSFLNGWTVKNSLSNSNRTAFLFN